VALSSEKMQKKDLTEVFWGIWSDYGIEISFTFLSLLLLTLLLLQP
jgi:hypothetical protein